MAERACHGFGSTTQVGLTQVLGRKEQRQAGAVAPESVSSSRRSSSLAFGLFPAARDSPAVRALGFGFFAAGHAVGWPASWSKPWLGQGSGAPFAAARRRSWLRGRPKQKACVPLPVVACCGLTIHSSRTRFAGRLNSGVRPCFPHCCWQVPGTLQRLAYPQRSHLARAVQASVISPATRRLRTGATFARFERPSRLRTGRDESSWPREPLVPAWASASASLRPFGQTCCTVRRRGWAVASSGASSACGGLTSRSSRS